VSPRPSIGLNSYGDIGVAPTGATARGSRYKARARYRDRTGAYRYVARFGQTKREAEQRLKAALDDLTHSGGGITSAATLTELAGQWLAEGGSPRAWSVNTRQVYGYAVERYVKPQLGQLRIREATTSTIDAALRRIADEYGKGAAKTTRSILSGMFRLAARCDLVTVNPVRETTPIGSERKDAVRALSQRESEDLTDLLRTDPEAVALDLPDLVEFMLGTGVRIGEALAVRDEVIDLELRTVHINRTVVRVKGVGLTLQPTKTVTSDRILPLPTYIADMIRRRQTELRFRSPEGALFPSPFRPTLRDPSNTQKAMRKVFDRHHFDWLHSHLFRKTVATALDRAGFKPREVADILGHAQPSMTQNVYFERKVNPDTAKALER
jgi:integrase